MTDDPVARVRAVCEQIGDGATIEEALVGPYIDSPHDPEWGEDTCFAADVLAALDAKNRQMLDLRAAFARYVQEHANCDTGQRIGVHEADYIVAELWQREEDRHD